MANKDSGENGTSSVDASPVDASTARRRQDALGRRLRQMYDNVVREPVPDDFLSFLEQADKRDEAAPQQRANGQIDEIKGSGSGDPSPAAPRRG